MKEYLKINASGESTFRLPGAIVPSHKTALLILSVLVVGLSIDLLIPVWGQIAAGIAAWGLFLLICRNAATPLRMMLMICLALATLGEFFFSLVWNLYDYRFFNIPHYVPPGHVLVFLLGCYIAPRMPKFTAWLVPLLSAPYIISGVYFGFDEFGILMFLFFIALIFSEENKKFYSTMFMLCMVLEIAGTWLGNWTWRPVTPVWNLTDTNPPLAAGALYCLLDFLTLRVSRGVLYLKDAYPRILAPNEPANEAPGLEEAVD